MADLVPEQRVDKNGVLNTKWIRPVAGSGGAAVFPAPVSVPKVTEDWESLVGSPIDAVYRKSSLHVESDNPLSIFDYDAVCIVNGMLSDGVYLSDQSMGVFNETHRRLVDGEDSDGDPVRAMNDLAVFGGIVCHEDSTISDVEPVVRGLEAHFGSNRDYLKGVTDEERSVALALATVVTRLEDEDFLDIDDPYDEGPGGAYIAFTLRSDELTELVKSRPEDAGLIARIVNERDSDDAALVAAVLDSQHKALHKGYL